MDVDKLAFWTLSIPLGLLEVWRSYTRYSSTTKDRRTLTFIWLVIPGSTALTMRLIRAGYGMKILENSWPKFALWLPMCSVICVLGCILRTQSINQLGQWFTTSICTDENQKIIDSGWYSRMRHPAYAGTLLSFVGVTLALNNWLGLIGILLPVFGVFRYRTFVEEKELEKHFGEQYRIYKKKVTKCFYFI